MSPDRLPQLSEPDLQKAELLKSFCEALMDVSITYPPQVDRGGESFSENIDEIIKLQSDTYEHIVNTFAEYSNMSEDTKTYLISALKEGCESARQRYCPSPAAP